MRAKKKRDLEVWNKALSLQIEIQTGCRADNNNVNALMAELKEELALVRKEGLVAYATD